ncbi:hypothetical protein [Microcoleus sp. B13-B4]
MGFEPDGSISLKSVSGGVNVAGFGVEGKVGQGGSGGLALTGFGITVDIAKDEKGGISGGISIRLPGGEIGIGFQRDPGTVVISTPVPEPVTPTYTEGLDKENISIPPEQPATKWPVPTGVNIDSAKGCTLKFFWRENHYSINPYAGTCESYLSQPVFYPYSSFGPTKVRVVSNTCTQKIRNINGLWAMQTTIIMTLFECELDIRIDRFASQSYLKQILDYVYYYYIPSSFCSYNWYLSEYGGGMPITTSRRVSNPEISVFGCVPPKDSFKIYPRPPSPVSISVQLPNHPQQIKPMDCCEQVKEIHKYLGIAKLKKNKFPVSNAFLVPGGKGNDNCIDYYAITQALFRMLANGLILNPKSKPLGSEWQNVNATAWAGQMYEMLAESMSDGNSSQRFEVAAIMQLVQIMSAIAETGRKVEFVADAIGIEPQLSFEDLPVCFTVHENHKGFGNSQPKKLKTSGLKSDEQVEEVLGKMLNPSKVPIVKWQFKPGQISINEALRMRSNG